jgi:hypothetical protein
MPGTVISPPDFNSTGSRLDTLPFNKIAYQWFALLGLDEGRLFRTSGHGIQIIWERAFIVSAFTCSVDSQRVVVVTN